MAPTISNTSELKTAIVHALENSPDDGSILLSSFHGAGGPFGDEIDPQIEIKGFGALPQEISETTYATLKSQHALKFPPEFEQAHRETLAHEAFIPSPKVVIGDPKWKAKVNGILQRLNVQDVFDLRSTGLLVSRHGTPAPIIYCNPAPEVAGAIIIVLPNGFRGARATTRHGARQETFIVDSTSGSRYNYIAWLQNCFVGVTPIESGFRVALTYDIVRRVPPPSPDSTGELADLQQILQYWVSNPQNTPKQLVYYLRDPFEVIGGVEEIPPMALSQMSFIRKAGESLGFQSRIACLTYTVRGRTSEKESEDSPGDVSQMDLADILEEQMQLEDLRGPDGLPSTFSSRAELTMFPEELLGYSPKELFDGRTEKPEEARGATERDSGVLLVEKVFRCNVLVVLPPNRHS